MKFITLPHEKLFDSGFALREDVGSKWEGNLIKVINKRQDLEYLLIEDILVKEDLLDLLLEALIH